MELEIGDYLTEIPDEETFNKIVQKFVRAGEDVDNFADWKYFIGGYPTLLWDEDNQLLDTSINPESDKRRFKRRLTVDDVLGETGMNLPRLIKKYCLKEGDVVKCVKSWSQTRTVVFSAGSLYTLNSDQRVVGDNGDDWAGNGKGVEFVAHKKVNKPKPIKRISVGADDLIGKKFEITGTGTVITIGDSTNYDFDVRIHYPKNYPVADWDVAIDSFRDRLTSGRYVPYEEPDESKYRVGQLLYSDSHYVPCRISSIGADGTYMLNPLVPSRNPVERSDLQLNKFHTTNYDDIVMQAGWEFKTTAGSKLVLVSKDSIQFYVKNVETGVRRSHGKSYILDRINEGSWTPWEEPVEDHCLDAMSYVIPNIADTPFTDNEETNLTKEEETIMKNTTINISVPTTAFATTTVTTIFGHDVKDLSESDLYRYVTRIADEQESLKEMNKKAKSSRITGQINKLGEMRNNIVAYIDSLPEEE